MEKPFDLKPWLESQPHLIDEWTHALGVGATAASTIVETLGDLSKTLAKLSPGALQAWRDQQQALLHTAQYVRPGTDKRAASAIARGAQTPFGQAIAGAAALHSVTVLCLIGDHAKHFPPTQQE